MRKLHALKLLEHDYERTSDNNTYKGKTQIKYPYKLSKYGIYNLITNNENLPFEIVKSLLSNYSDHILFGFFLFPYIKQETLSKEKIDSARFSQIFSYLHDCCKRLEDMFFKINHTSNQKNGYLIDSVFIWENVPREDYDRESLRNFLKKKSEWGWVEKAEIKKTPDGNSVEVSYELKRILISIDKKRRKAILSFKGRKEYEFVVRELTNDQFAVDACSPSDWKSCIWKCS